MSFLKRHFFAFLSLIPLISQATFSEDSSKTNPPYRYYEFGYGLHNDLQNSAINGLSLFKVTQDAFTYGIKPKMGVKAGNFVGGLWSFASTYLGMLWSHEFGHFYRARQVNGEFRFHNFGLPIPYTTMHLPDDISHLHAALSVTGGFEINAFTARRVQLDFMQHNGINSDELGLAGVHRLMYPIYSSIIIRRDAMESETWIKTAGDPVHFVLPVWQAYSNNEIFMADSSVNLGLAKFYNQSALFATFFNFLDPNFYQQMSALFGNTDNGKKPFNLIGNEQRGWTYGTLFNASPLGYELYFINYIKWNKKLYSLSFKTGAPFKNNALSFNAPKLINYKKLCIGLNTEVWDQDVYGKGIAAFSDINYEIANQFTLHINTGYKTEGYMLGRQLDAGIVAFTSVKFSPKYTR